MGRRADQEVSINVRAKDEASKQLQKVGQTVGRLPEQFSKSAAALNAFSSASTQLSGKAADLANKLTGVASLVATGGMVGVGIAAITAAVGAGTTLWDMHSKIVGEADAAYRAVTQTLDRMSNALTKQQDRIQALQNQVRFFGKDMRDVEITILKEAIETKQTYFDRDKKITEAKKEQSAALEAEAEAYLKNVHSTRLASAADGVHVQKLKEKAAQLKQEAREMEATTAFGDIKIAADRKQLDLLEQLKVKFDQEAIAKKRSAAASKQHAIDEKEALKARELAHKNFDAMVEALHKKSEDRRKAEIQFAFNEAEEVRKLEDWKAEKTKEFAERDAAMAKERADLHKQVAMGIAQSISGAFTQIMNDTANAHIYILQMVVDAAEKAIMAYAAQAAAAAAATGAILGPIGMMVGAAIAFGLVKALISQLPKADVPKAQHGMRVRGGVPGLDTVPVMMQQGEVALDRNQTGLLDRLVATLEGGLGKPAFAGAMAGGGGITLNYAPRSLVPETSAHRSRSTNMLLKQLRRAQKRGF